MDTNNQLVQLSCLDADIIEDLVYKTRDNFLKKAIYPVTARAYLRTVAAEALCKASRIFKSDGYKVKVWDAYRPFSLQKIFWEALPDEQYIPRPIERNGKMLSGSPHNRGVAVDITLINSASGKEIKMPTTFDDFTEKAHRNCIDLASDVIHNRDYLTKVMAEVGFVGMKTEWWHFNWKNVEEFDLLDIPIG